MTRLAPPGGSRRARRALTACAVLLGVVAPALQASPAHASDPLTFDHIAGRPRHQTPEDVAVDADGNVYVTESASVTSTPGDRVTKYDANGTFLDVLAGPDLTVGDGSGTPGLLANPVSVAVAPNGNVYVLENGYPATEAWPTNEVSYYDALGNHLASWGGYGTGSGQFKQPQGIAVDSTGDVYVADNGNDRIQRFSSAGDAETSWFANNVADVALDGSDVVWTAGDNEVNRYDKDGTPLNSWSVSGSVGIVVDTVGTAWVSLGNGTIRHYDAAGTLLATISGSLTAPQGLDITDAGTLYVADPGTGKGQVSVFSTASFETQWAVSGVRDVGLSGSTVVAADGTDVRTYGTSGTAGTSWASSGSRGVATDGAGNAWVSSNADGVVRGYDASGSLLTTIGAGDLSGPKGVAYSGTDLFVADAGNNRIVRYDPGGALETSWPVTGVIGVAYAGGTVYATDGSSVRTYAIDGTAGPFWASAGARGIAVDGSGFLWVSSSAGVVRSYTSTGTFRFSVGSGVLSDPEGVAVGGGELYVADSGKVKRFATSMGYQFEWGHYPANGVEDVPTGVAADSAGNVYVTNKAQDVIQKFDANGVFLQNIGSGGSSPGLLQNPEAVAIGPTGDVYVADTTNQRIQRFDSTGAFELTWGSYGPENGRFNDPAGIAVDAAGNVYVADTGNHRIQKFDANGVYLTKWGLYGTGTGQFKYPRGLTVVGGSVWVADSGMNRIQKFSTAGVFQAAWGSSGSTDGKLSGPYDVALDAEGTVWVVERTNNRIQRFTTTGAYLSKLGVKGLDAGEFDAPSGLEIDAAGRVIVADSNNHRVQVFVDNNGPDVTFTNGPGTATKSSSATFQYTANEPGSTFECKLDAGAWAPCGSSVTYSSLAEGSHTAFVRATDSAAHLGNPSTYNWAVDLTPPTVSMTSAPVSPSASTSPSFSFLSSEGNSTYLCQLDTAAIASCTSPKTVAVTNGAHTFKVWAIDAAGNQSTAPATHAWTVDTTPPNVTIDSGPSGWVAQTNATFAFSSPDAGATFECHLDGAAFAPCASPITYPGLSAAQHTFTVRGIDALGNISADKTRTWTVDLADHRPDALISSGKNYLGNTVYNGSGLNQTATVKKGVGSTAAFTLKFENDGSDTDVYTIKGPGSVNGYSVSYWIGTTSYTTKVTGGTLKFTLSPGEFKTLTLKVKVGSTGKASAGFVITATSGHEASKLDAVKAVVKRV